MSLKINNCIIELRILYSRRLMVSPFYLLLLMNHNLFCQEEAILAFGFWFERVRVLQRLLAVRLTVFPPSLCLLIPNRDRSLLNKKLRVLQYNKVFNNALILTRPGVWRRVKFCERRVHNKLNLTEWQLPGQSNSGPLRKKTTPWQRPARSGTLLLKLLDTGLCLVSSLSLVPMWADHATRKLMLKD